MDSDDLTKAQALQMHAAICERAKYLERILDRMKVKRWPITDPVFVKTKAAYDALCSLAVELHLNSLDGAWAGKNRNQREAQTEERRTRGEL